MLFLTLAAAAALLKATPEGVFAWRTGAVYPILARPGRVTDVVLEPGERLSAANPVAAGDTLRWIIGDSESGSGPARQVHVLLKPVEAGLATNLVIATDRRVYHLELASSANRYIPVVSWRYPEGELLALKGAQAPAETTSAPGALTAPPASTSSPSPESDLSRLNFGYRIEGAAPFRPLRVFDDGRRTVIDFPPSTASGEMPPLFVMNLEANGRPGDLAELVNYRVVGRRMVVDRLFDAAELRLGGGTKPARVRIVREAAAAP